MTPLNLFERWRNCCKTEAAKVAKELESRVHPVNPGVALGMWVLLGWERDAGPRLGPGVYSLAPGMGGPRQQARVSTGRLARWGCRAWPLWTSPS